MLKLHLAMFWCPNFMKFTTHKTIQYIWRRLGYENLPNRNITVRRICTQKQKVVRPDRSPLLTPTLLFAWTAHPSSEARLWFNRCCSKETGVKWKGTPSALSIWTSQEQGFSKLDLLKTSTYSTTSQILYYTDVHCGALGTCNDAKLRYLR